MTFKTYHIMDLPDGTATDGEVDRRCDPRYFGLEGSPLVKGARVIDVGAFDGFWAFWADKAAADYALATDVDFIDSYDWGAAGPPDVILGVPREEIPPHDVNFETLKRLLGSSVERKRLSVYEHTVKTVGEFDLVFCYGLIYHLRHPLLAIDRLRGICRGATLLESHVPSLAPKLPYLVFYQDDVLVGNAANWCGPSEAFFVHALRDAGFEHVFYENPKTNPAALRQRFAGCVTNLWADHMRANPNFIEADEAYFRRSHELIARLLRSEASVWEEANA